MVQAKTVVAASTLLTSMIAYWYAKSAKKDVVPFIMLGGFVGSVLGETLVEHLTGETYEPMHYYQ